MCWGVPKLKGWISRVEEGGKCGSVEAKKGSLRGFLPGEKGRGVGQKKGGS